MRKIEFMWKGKQILLPATNWNAQCHSLHVKLELLLSRYSSKISKKSASHIFYTSTLAHVTSKFQDGPGLPPKE